MIRGHRQQSVLAAIIQANLSSGESHFTAVDLQTYIETGELASSDGKPLPYAPGALQALQPPPRK